jgi:quercetin dioxygenase-like cupin family protein
MIGARSQYRRTSRTETGDPEMAYSGQVIDNPVSGERFVFHRTAGDTGGELLAFELTLDPDGHVPGGHVHPVQEERFEVVRGTMRFRKGLRSVVATAGDTVVVPPGTYHKFTNVGDEPAVVRVQVTPALRMEQLFETAVVLAREGRTLPTGMPRPLDLALFMREFEQEVRAAFAPEVVRAVMAPLAWLGERRGLADRYRVARRPAATHPGAGRPSGTRPSPARPPTRPRPQPRRAA